MSRNITFSFELDKNTLTHLKNVSYCNHNYYHVDFTRYGDYILPEQCNTLYEEAIEDCSKCYYSLGYFKNGKFQAMFTWLDDSKDLNGILDTTLKTQKKL